MAEKQEKSHISVMIYHKRLINPPVSTILEYISVSVLNKLKYLTMLATVSPPKTEINDMDRIEGKFYILPIINLITLSISINL